MLFVFWTEPDTVQPKLSQLLIDQDTVLVVARRMVDRSTATSREGSLLTLGLGHHLSHLKHSPILIGVEYVKSFRQKNCWPSATAFTAFGIFWNGSKLNAWKHRNGVESKGEQMRTANNSCTRHDLGRCNIDEHSVLAEYEKNGRMACWWLPCLCKLHI